MDQSDANIQQPRAEPTHPKVAVIVLTWNGKHLTLPCLESLMDSRYPRTEIFLVDNASTDGTADAVEEKYGERIRIIRNQANLGFAGGNNVGIQHAMDGGADFVLLLNNDTLVDPEMIDHLVKAIMEQPQAGIAGPKIFYESPPDQIWFAGGEVFLGRGTARHIGIRERDQGQHDTIREVDYVSGCALMAGREVFEKIGLLDPIYEAYFEDTDFCMRAKMKGFRTYYVPHGRVWHKISSSTGGQLGRRKIKRKLRSSWIFFRRYSKPYHWLSIPFFFSIDVIRIIILVATGKIRDASSIEKKESA
ncbi:MAG: glycosyltransferase [Candidatus Latescibacteria bacterium]|nr:glycosyltransferase [Candidatus Latescibacterota bacterium]NIM21216.1 glycosyltransferase [Candidatus Latescibacterota bacterium]NIM65470.1 glycosyltransferase [Candidatus Latescibacterota bacterium]NIO01848.1 glycosyltransferase [Candidatus Latescibacterota bacterium]NIO28498.1 glycosyltransferase [Candidatus Latescibacterota bacterium]